MTYALICSNIIFSMISLCYENSLQNVFPLTSFFRREPDYDWAAFVLVAFLGFIFFYFKREPVPGRFYLYLLIKMIPGLPEIIGSCHFFFVRSVFFFRCDSSPGIRNVLVHHITRNKPAHILNGLYDLILQEFAFELCTLIDPFRKQCSGDEYRLFLMSPKP